jgi:signal transduction histidine kinase
LITCPEDIFIEFDEAQFDVLLTQLCDNSLYAIKARDVTSELTISVVQTDDKNIELSVSDNGKGIAADVGDKVFFPFYSTKKTGEGLGLGLSIVKQIVMNHDGHIYYSSEPEKGTKFVCVLPVVV